MIDLDPEHDRARHVVERRRVLQPPPGLYRPALVVALIGILLSLAGGYAVAHWERLAALTEFEGLAENQAIVMQNGTNEYVSRLMALRTLFESSNEEITRSEFESFSGRLFEAHPGILRVAWLPRVRHRERAEYEAAAIADGISSYRIKSPDGQPGAPLQDDYFPVFFSTEPKTSRVYGLDYAAMPERRAALERARDTDSIVVQRIGLLFGSSADPTGVLVCVPVYTKGTSRDTIADRRRNLSGYVVSILDLPLLLQSIRASARVSPAISIGVYPPGGVAENPGLPDFASDPQARRTMPSLDSAPQWSSALLIGDSRWPMRAAPAAGGPFMALHYRALALLGVGLVLTALLAVYLGLASRSSFKLTLANRRVLELAQTDILTGLPNRAFFLERLQTISAFEREHGASFSILMLDLDRFKNVNDSLGHAAGDELLRLVGQRLKSTLRENDVLARLGGDEFAIIQAACNDQRSDAIDLAMRIERLIAQPFQLSGSRVEIGTSIGIALCPEHDNDLEQLLTKADLALYRSKSAGRNCHTVYDEAMSAELEARNTLEADLRDAIARCEFELHYQPFYDLQTGRRSGLEALVRWRHPVKGLIPPDQFIPLAEETGLIVPLGEWVLRQACDDATSLPSDLKVAVNLSPVQFKQAELFDVIRSALDSSGLAPERLEIEITESVLLEQAAENHAFLEHLKSIGVSLALDDFGTGYSSLSYLTAFPFDKIKIDKSFIRGMEGRQQSSAIIASTVTLARGLNIMVTAEGVETREQLDRLKSLGVNFAQGYLLGRPVPIAELEHQHHARLARQDAA